MLGSSANRPSPSPVKILYHHRTQAEDGQAVHIRSLIEAFQGEGHEVREVALVERSTGDTARPQPSRPPRRWSPWALFGLLPGFVKELAEYGYSVHARRRLQRAAQEFQPDVIYERYAFGNSAGVATSEALNIPLILEVNSPLVLELSRTRGLAFPRLARRVENRIFQRATRVCVVTEVLKGMVAELGVDPDRIFVTPNGVHPELYEDLDREAARKDLGIESTSGPVLGFVGYYRDWHRLDLVLDGMATEALASAHLVLVGTGPAEESLRSKARDLVVHCVGLCCGRWHDNTVMVDAFAGQTGMGQGDGQGDGHPATLPGLSAILPEGIDATAITFGWSPGSPSPATRPGCIKSTGPG